jgi:hypothetical protein
MTVTLAQVATAFLSKQGLASSTVRTYELTLLSKSAQRNQTM